VANSLKEIKAFLNANRYEEVPTAQHDLERGLHPFVTISREYGAGGHGLAQYLLKLFENQDSPLFQGWRIQDRELCEKLVADNQLNQSIRALLSEKYQSEIEALVFSLLGEPSQKTLIYTRLFELIRTLATFGKVIIIGRAGCCITKSLPLGIHIRLVAPLEYRRERMESVGRQSKRLVQQIDRDRSRFLKVHFNRDISDPLLYDIVFNTGKVPLASAAQVILTMIHSKIAEEENQQTLELFAFQPVQQT